MKVPVRRLAIWLLIGLPFLSLALNAVNWLRYGIDLPIYDDWFGYASGMKGSLSAANIFKPVNNTLAPVGYLLDTFAQRYLDGNAVPYQLLSMLLVLGALLWLQWSLLLRALGDRYRAALCFVLTLLMLQPGSYWGQQSLAYHQALPLVFILSTLVLLLMSTWRDAVRLPLVAVLGLLAGFSYISGAFAVLAVGVVLWGIGFVCTVPAMRSSLWRGGAVLTLVGVFSSAVQFILAVYPNPGLTHRPDAPLALPTQYDFWIYMLGKLGRSLLLPLGWPAGALVLTACLSGLAVLVAVLLARRLLLRRPMSAEVWTTSVVFIVLGAGIFVYLMLIAAGRTHLRPPEIVSTTQVFAFGFERFHFFWATLLWPWLAAACLAVAGHRSRRVVPIATLAAAVAVTSMLYNGALAHAKAHREQAQSRQVTIVCLLAQLQRGEPIDCPEFVLADVIPGYAYARETGASFVRYFPALAMPMGSDDPPPWFRLSRDRARTGMHDLAAVAPDAGAMWRATGPDPQMQVQIGNADGMAACRLLDVTVLLKAEQNDVAQLFYRPKGAAGYTEETSMQLPVEGGGDQPRKLHFQIASPRGFEDALRIDPVMKPQQLQMPEIEVRCHLVLR